MSHCHAVSGPADFEHGRGLVFLLGAFRSGTTLLRKMLDSHPQVHSPAETWFLLPLLSMWEGSGTCPRFNPAQASAALRGHVSQEQFMDCCRAFAGRFYAAGMPAGKCVYVDKTPMYLSIAGALPQLFPIARFIVLARDPRAILWSRHTWRHADRSPIESRVKGVAGDVRRLAAFAREHAPRCALVRYEDLCVDPEPGLLSICGHIGVGFDSRMIDYGKVSHQEGYGDENTRDHQRPHADSVARWGSELTPEIERNLFSMCTGEALATLGYSEALHEAA
ncbi:MAG: sulfotransferase [Phycisphaerales bacterium]|nr:sulfotransferase [Phycisphaerales bacterium]